MVSAAAGLRGSWCRQVPGVPVTDFCKWYLLCSWWSSAFIHWAVHRRLQDQYRRHGILDFPHLHVVHLDVLDQHLHVLITVSNKVLSEEPNHWISNSCFSGCSLQPQSNFDGTWTCFKRYSPIPTLLGMHFSVYDETMHLLKVIVFSSHNKG